jgi:hypothetical protein
LTSLSFLFATPTDRNSPEQTTKKKWLPYMTAKKSDVKVKIQPPSRECNDSYIVTPHSENFLTFSFVWCPYPTTKVRYGSGCVNSFHGVAQHETYNI